MKTSRKNITMKTIAATLAALSIMSTFSAAAGATEFNDQTALPDTEISTDLITDSTTETPTTDDTAAAVDETTDTALGDPTDETTADALPADEAAATYTITFDTDGGSYIEPITAEAGTEIVRPAEPTKDGFYFIRWSATIPEFMPEEDLTITAIWSETPDYNTLDEAFADKANLRFTDDEENVVAKASISSAAAYEEDPVLTSSANFYNMTPVCMAANSTSFEDDLQAFGKDAGIAMADEAFDLVGDAIPGGKILMSPFKVLFHRGVDDPDPMDAMNEKLDNIDNKLDGICAELENINKNIDRNTEWLAREIKNVNDMGDVMKEFRALAPDARDLSRDIQGIEDNPQYTNNYVKTLELARLGNKRSYIEVSQHVYTLQKHMHGGNSAYANLFVAAFNSAASRRMVSREAYEDAKEMLGDLLTEYVSAVALMEEVELAQRAVEKFGDYEISQLDADDAATYRYYKKHEMNRMTKNYNDTINAIVACGNGVSAFDKTYNNSDFINKGFCRKPLNVEYTLRYAVITNRKGDPGYEIYDCFDNRYGSVNNKDSSLTDTERKDLIDYIRTERAGMSIDGFFRKYGVNIEDLRDVDLAGGNVYLITDDKINESIKFLDRRDPDFMTREEYYQHKYYFTNAIKATDTTLTENPLYCAKAMQRKIYLLGCEDSRKFYECYSTYINFLIIL